MSIPIHGLIAVIFSYAHSKNQKNFIQLKKGLKKLSDTSFMILTTINKLNYTSLLLFTCCIVHTILYYKKQVLVNNVFSFAEYVGSTFQLQSNCANKLFYNVKVNKAIVYVFQHDFILFYSLPEFLGLLKVLGYHLKYFERL